jgi:hypothetical protein
VWGLVTQNLNNLTMTEKQNKMITKSIEERALNIMLTGIKPLEAVKQAIIEENKLIEEMIAQITERSIKAKNQIMKNTYVLIHSLN